MKKTIAPVIITLITVTVIGLYAWLYIFIFTEAQLPVWISILTGVVFLGILLAMVIVLKARLIELKKEKEDDYSKY